MISDTIPPQLNNDSPRRVSSRFLSLIMLLLIILSSFRLGHYFGTNNLTFKPSKLKVVNSTGPVNEPEYNLLWQALNVLNEKYIEKPVDPKKALYGAIKGAVGATGDPYTEFLTPEDLTFFESDMKGSFDGIGAEVGKRNGSIVIIAPLEGSPAEQAGLRPKDFILQVDGKPTQDWTVEQAVSAIRGQKGTEVKLNIFREGKAAPFDVVIKRDKIVIQSVKLKFETRNNQNVAVLTIARFGDDTEELFRKAVKELKAKGVKYLILDLRNNPGGYLDSSVEVASFWIPKNQLVVKEVKSTEPSEDFVSKGYLDLQGIKTMVLINGGSASASEILAGALQDYKLGLLIGEKSFGKGSVQELIELENNSAVKVTVAKWQTPKGKNINKDGLTPDIEVKRSEEDIEKDLDPQLDKAFEEVIK